MERPGIKDIISNDWPALAFLVAVPILPSIGILFLIKGNYSNADQKTLYICLGASLLCAWGLKWRVDRIKWFFTNGIRVQGVITFIQLAKDRGRIEFAYEMDGAAFRSWHAVHQSRRVLGLKAGEPVQVPGRSGSA